MKNIKKLDGSFIININNMPYNTVNGDKYYENTLKMFNSDPELFDVEVESVIKLDELKKIKIAEAKINVERLIFSVYPQYKQNNIAIFGNEEERENFKIFKNSKVNLYRKTVNEIESCETMEELSGINIVL